VRSTTRVLAALALSTLAVAGTSAPAYADAATTSIGFDGANADADFGAPWLLEIRVANAEDPVPLGPSSGTVSVFLDGETEPYATELPIAAGGYAYFAQPAEQPPLVAGEHSVIASFVPTGADLAPSTTRSPATITITPLGVTGSIEVVTDPARYAVPTVEAKLGGGYVSAYDSAPAGQWTIVVSQDGGSEVFSGSVAQTSGLELPSVIPIDSGLEPGENYTVTGTFVPDDAIAGGLTLAEIAPVTFESEPAGAFDGAVQPVFLPVWALILGGVLFLAAAALFVFVLLRTRAPAKASGKRVAVREPVVLAPEEDFGDLESIDDLFTPTQHFEAIRISEPAELPRGADAPTELLDAAPEEEKPRTDGGSSWSINGGS